MDDSPPLRVAVLGFPRIGPNRELKRALEAHWSGRADAAELEAVARALRRGNLLRGSEAGVDILPSNDFSLYDHVLDGALMVGAVPSRFGDRGLVGLDLYFAMARGTAEVRPLEMTKWLDTNYHYLVPEVGPATRFRLDATKPLAEFRDGLEWGVRTRPVLIGPASFLHLAKARERGFDPLSLLDSLLPVYADLLAQLAAAGAREVQIDEPCLVLDPDEPVLAAVERAWTELAASCGELRLTLATYFSGLGRWLDRILHLPAAEFHLDVVRDRQQLEPALSSLPDAAALSLGLVDGRNVWTTDLQAALGTATRAIERLGPERVRVATSCSLLHVPYSAQREQVLDAEMRSWLAFGDEKLAELVTLRSALAATDSDRDEILGSNRAAVSSRRASSRVHQAVVRERLAGVAAGDMSRLSPFSRRATEQQEHLQLPLFPTTTIGSFPQTTEIRQMRARARRGELATAEYEDFLEQVIADVVRRQEDIGLDVLVHGEAERNDMVEYFAEHLDGFVISQWGWVQSYGSRCVKPAILFGDVSRPAPITVRWWRFSQSCTSRPVKGMLTGPVTILQWSFVRDDQPRETTCRQLALAMRDEVLDLESAGAKVIQIDEAALREGLPLRRDEQDAYLRWAIDCFRLTANGVADHTQIHSHMCYSEFNEIVAHIARMDADVISIEASRSRMEILDALRDFAYPNAVGPGVYDIHSPRVPSLEEIERLLDEAEARIPRERLWVNPDCGLKTRRWEEVVPALEHLVEAARRRRAGVAAGV